MKADQRESLQGVGAEEVVSRSEHGFIMLSIYMGYPFSSTDFNFQIFPAMPPPFGR
jgi:hypothetical protein